jgi:cytochrome c553
MRQMTHPMGAAVKGAALVATVAVTVAFGLYQLTDGKIAEDPSLPTPATIAAVERLQASDPQRGARAKAGMTLYRHSCRLCHNRSGHGGNFTPSLARHNAQSAIVMLNLYRSGQTVGPMTHLMAPWAKELTEEEMRNLADYIELLASVRE